MKMYFIGKPACIHWSFNNAVSVADE